MRFGQFVMVKDSMPVFPETRGMLCRITSSLTRHVGKTMWGELVAITGYQVKFNCGRVMAIEAQYLEELKPPVSRGDLDTKVTWKELEAATGHKRRPEDLV